MKRLHVHVGVDDLEQSIRFYTELFGEPPGKKKDGYARWMLENPRVNFAISARGASRGIDHLGFQVDDEDELTELRRRAESAGTAAVLDEGETTCCYAQSAKHWTVDPQGVAWEHFHTMGEALEYGSNGPSELACCAGTGKADAEAGKACGCG